MSLMELKEKAATLSAKERFQLAAFLAELEEQTETEFRETVDRRMKAMDAGKKVAMDEFESEHARRPSQGNQ